MEENKEQVPSTPCQSESEEMSSTDLSTTEEDEPPIEFADAAVGTSDWFREGYGVRQNGAAFNTRGLPNDDDTDELGLTRPVCTVSTQTDPADLVGDPRGLIIPYGPRSSTSRVYNSQGIHIPSGLDLCDCYVKECPGCQMSCSKCGSCKCGSECRRNRSY